MLRAPELLIAQHALDSFDSGVRSLDDWLRRRLAAESPKFKGMLTRKAQPFRTAGEKESHIL